MVIVELSVHDKLGKAWFFEETFLPADTSMEVVLRISFPFLSNANIQFGTRELTWGIYTTTKTMPTTRQVELINKHECTRKALDEASKTFVVHVTALKASSEMTIHHSRATQVTTLQQTAQWATLQWDKASIEICANYTDYVDIFSPN